MFFCPKLVNNPQMPPLKSQFFRYFKSALDAVSLRCQIKHVENEEKLVFFMVSTTGTTESVARLIAEKLGVSPADVHDVSKLDAALAESYEALILGTSTWGDGELQDDWYDGIKVLKNANLSGKTIALFGCRRFRIYSDTSATVWVSSLKT